MVQFVNMRELKVHASSVIRRSRNGDVVVTLRGKPKAVIHALDEDDLESYLMENSPVFLRKVAQAIQEARREKTHSYKEVFGHPQPDMKKELGEIVRELKLKYRPEEIILFGSLARGAFARDIDLVVIKRTEKPFVDRLREVALLHNAQVGVDILVYTPEEWKRLRSEGDRFISEEVLKKGRVLYRAA